MKQKNVVLLHHSDMTAAETRRENARELANKVGSPAALARLLGISEQQLSQTIGKSPTRNIGAKLARRMESVTGMPNGWLDNKAQPRPAANNPGDLFLAYITSKEAALITAYRETVDEDKRLFDATAAMTKKAKIDAPLSVINGKPD